jgi:hypothetical protein
MRSGEAEKRRRRDAETRRRGESGDKTSRLGLVFFFVFLRVISWSPFLNLGKQTTKSHERTLNSLELSAES